MKKTLRLIITLDCNLSCEYCCNKLPEVSSKFVTKRLDEIDFEQYEAVCITGGEPLLKFGEFLHNIYYEIPVSMPLFLYTNGLLLNKGIASYFNGVNIGIHYKGQMKQLLEEPSLLFIRNLRLYVQDIHREEYLSNIPDEYVHTWTMNDCFNNVETEDWILLKE